MRVYAYLVLAGIWYFFSFILQVRYLPYPHTVIIHTFDLLISGYFVDHILISALRMITAIAVAGCIAIPLGILTGRSKIWDIILTPIAQILFPVPKVALLPVIILLFGLGNTSKIILIILIVFFQLFFVSHDAAKNVDKRYIDSIRSLGGSNISILLHAILPAILPGVLTAARISTGTAAAVLFLAESFASMNGLGWFIIDAWSRLHYEDMFSGIVALSGIGIILFHVFSFLEKKFCSWI